METMKYILIINTIFLLIACEADDPLSSSTVLSGEIPVVTSFNAGLLFPNGIEPGDPSVCEATPPNRCWWVDAGAAAGGDGSFATPYNSFEQVVGYREVGSYTTGLLQGGDHLYLRGTFDMDDHIEGGGKTIRLYLGNPSQGGTENNPTVIKSYKGENRAIFDGQYRLVNSMDSELSGLIHIATSFSTPISNILIQNIEVKDAVGIGISFVENVVRAEVAGVIVHDTGIRPNGSDVTTSGASSSGGIHFRMNENMPNFTIRNSLFYNNFRLGDGSGFFTGSSNNIGGINILGSDEVENGAKITIRDNIILNEFYAIRHKRSGNIETEVSTNIIDTAIMGFYIRGYRNNIFRHNLVRNISDSAVYLDAENQNGPMQVNVWNNTITESVRFINTGFNDEGLARTLNVQNNIFSSTVERFPIALSRDPSDDDYDLSQWSSNNNIFNVSGTTILKNKGIEYNFVDSMSQLNDTTSITGDPLFVNEVGSIAVPITNITTTLISVLSADYSLASGSPALNTGGNNFSMGAFQ